MISTLSLIGNAQADFKRRKHAKGENGGKTDRKAGVSPLTLTLRNVDLYQLGGSNLVSHRELAPDTARQKVMDGLLLFGAVRKDRASLWASRCHHVVPL